MAQILLTTTGTLTPVIITDLGRRSFVHPTTDFDLLTEYTHSQVMSSPGLETLRAAGNITLKDADGISIISVEDLAPIKNNVTTTDPVVASDNTAGYAVDSLWYATTSGMLFVCTDNSTGAAVWEQVVTGLSSVISKAAPYTLLATDSTIIVTAATTITLPAVSGLTGKEYSIIHDSASGIVILDANGAETINGGLTVTLASRYTALTVINTGTAWLIK